MKKFRIRALILIILSSISSLCFAATSTTTFTVNATVSDSCSVSANNLSFGSYEPTGITNLDETTTISVTCTLGTVYNTGLDAGTGSGATVTTRKMTSGSDLLNYSLYSNVTHTTVWGDTVGVNTMPGVGTGSAQNLTVYGRIPSGQSSVPAGSYSDTITVTVTY
ncbi:MAG: spore coat protein [Legionellales bacterium]|nr:spore coat protein [Legionellales bacterium]|tara:strand:+ start:53871 stop:54365 length:495 start_codon:yes stop_codon:yes gene_type:complete